MYLTLFVTHVAIHTLPDVSALALGGCTPWSDLHTYPAMHPFMCFKYYIHVYNMFQLHNEHIITHYSIMFIQ